MKVILYYIGKPRNADANRLAAEYTLRSSRFASVTMRELRPERSDLWEKHPAARTILLDPGGRRLDSAAFTELVRRSEFDSRDLVFLVGGADGLPAGWSARADLLLSLTPLTLPHELARVLLAEQIYRAFATLRGHPYPR